MSDLGAGGRGDQPFKPFHVMLQQEIDQASYELDRTSRGLLLSSISAGIGIGVSVLLIAAVHSAAAEMNAVALKLIIANLYAVGFVIVILGRMDLFTEFTTIAILPVLAGRASLGALVRFWGLIYAGNLLGAIAFSLFIVAAAPRMDLARHDAFAELALDLSRHAWWVVVLSAALAGWLMGALSWLIIGGRDTISQFFFVWVIAFAIGFAHLHHVVVGGLEMICGALASDRVTGGDVVRILAWTTIGNIIGGVLFAASIQYSIRLRHRDGADRG